MKLNELLNLCIEGQVVEFNYIDTEGYVTNYDIPMYVKGETENDTILEFLDLEIENIYSNAETDGWNLEYDYLSVVLKGGK